MEDFRFNIGDLVDVYEGWEYPIHRGLKVVNRRRKHTHASQAGIVFTEEYLVADKYETETTIYDIAALKEHDGGLIGRPSALTGDGANGRACK